MVESNELAGTREPGTVWLASFPKSGNTWVRAVIAAVRDGDHMFNVDQLASGAQPHHVGGARYAYGLDPRWLDLAEIDQLRDSLVSRGIDERARSSRNREADGRRDEGAENEDPPGTDNPPDDRAPMFRKTHEMYRHGPPGMEPFPTRATRAAILIVRDPRSVVCSWAPFFGVDLEKAVKQVGEGKGGKGSSAMSTTEQPWGTWTSHAGSWLDPAVPFPVHIVRYEDLKADAVAALLPVLNAVGSAIDEAELKRAVERTSFDQLVKDEADSGFREVSPRTERFFRRGGSQTWQDELGPELVEQVESDHAEMMARLGYEASEVNLRDPIEATANSAI